MVEAHVHSTVLHLEVHFRVFTGVLLKNGCPYVHSDMKDAVISLKHEAQLSCPLFKNYSSGLAESILRSHYKNQSANAVYCNNHLLF
jgi:hypothetical protein